MVPSPWWPSWGWAHTQFLVRTTSSESANWKKRIPAWFHSASLVVCVCVCVHVKMLRLIQPHLYKIIIPFVILWTGAIKADRNSWPGTQIRKWHDMRSDWVAEGWVCRKLLFGIYKTGLQGRKLNPLFYGGLLLVLEELSHAFITDPAAEERSALFWLCVPCVLCVNHHKSDV